MLVATRCFRRMRSFQVVQLQQCEWQGGEVDSYSSLCVGETSSSNSSLCVGLQDRRERRELYNHLCCAHLMKDPLDCLMFALTTSLIESSLVFFISFCLKRGDSVEE